MTKISFLFQCFHFFKILVNGMQIQDFFKSSVKIRILENEEKQKFVELTPGVDFTNIIYSAFMLTDLKSNKDSQVINVFLCF